MTLLTLQYLTLLVPAPVPIRWYLESLLKPGIIHDMHRPDIAVSVVVLGERGAEIAVAGHETRILGAC